MPRGMGIRTGRSHIDNSPPGGWAHQAAEDHIEDMKKSRYEHNKKVKGKWRIVLTKPTGTKLYHGNIWTYADAVREVEKQTLKELKLGPHAGSYEVEEYHKNDGDGRSSTK